MDHLNAPTFDALTAQHLPRAQARPAVLHLLACSRCQDRLLDLYPFQGRLLLERLLDEPAERLEGALRQTRIAMEPRKAWALRETERAAVLFAELEPLSPAHRRLRALNSSRFANLSLVARLLEESRLNWNSDPEQSEIWAMLACDLVGSTELDAVPQSVRLDLESRAWSYRGSSLRLLSRYAQAEDALVEAARKMRAGSGDVLEMARYQTVRMLLLRDQSRFDEGVLYGLEAKRLYDNLGHVRAVARVTIALAKGAYNSGRPGESVAMLDDLFNRFTRRHLGSQLFTMALQNQLLALVETGEAERAASAFKEIRSTPSLQGHSRLRARLAWTDGLVQARLGRTHSAVRLLRHARHRLQYIACDRAYLDLDLARVLVTSGGRDEARQLSLESLQFFVQAGAEKKAREAKALLSAAEDSDHHPPGL